MNKKLFIFFMVGVVGYYCTKYLFPSLIEHANTITYLSYFHNIIEDGSHFISLISKIFIFGSVFLFAVIEIFSKLWENIIEGLVFPLTENTKNHLKDVSSEVALMRKNTDDLNISFKNFLVDSKKPLSMENSTTYDDYNKLLLPPCKEIYGKHIDNINSLFTYVRKVYLDGFSNAPHPSGVTKKINIDNHQSNPEYVLWKEETRYKIHHVAFATKPEIGKYLLRFKVTSFAPDLEKEQWAQSLQFKLRVDDTQLISPGSVPKFVDSDTDDEGFYCTKRDSWVELWYKKQIELYKEWTDVVSEEISINSKLDRVYTLNTTKPTCNYTLDITLPNDLKFIKHPFVTPKIIYSGLPEFIKKDLPKRTTIDYDSANHIRITIKEWVMPGIVVNLNWIDA